MNRPTIQIRFPLFGALALGLLLMGSSNLLGQMTTSGMFGSRTLGSPTSSRSGGGSAGVGTTLEQLSSVGDITNSERFVRGARQAGQFVGSDTRDTGFVGSVDSGATGSAMGGRGMTAGGMYGGSSLLGGSSMLGGGRGGLSGMMGMGGLNQRGMTQRGGMMGGNRGMNQMGRMGGNRTVNLQTQMTVGFRYASLPATRVQNTVERRLNSANRIQKRGSIQLEVEDRIATLRGVVATEEDRKLAVRMAQLEPGISEVRDELSVAASADPTPPAPQDR